MSTITIRLNNDEQKAFNEYAKLYNVPLSTLFKKSLEEKIEDEMDMKFIKEYEADIQNGAVELYEHNKVREMLGL
ncbi:type II toxin-antitoxin system RelB family antitoxin [Carnobacterium sp.]|uniref:type II toxin-antitoxin system RelB family antitoxin n=1 Tax=Carnobacterium sp. TaxID=48221 RepID=UPI003C768E25